MASRASSDQDGAVAPKRGSVIGGIFPFIGVILFVAATIVQFTGGAGDDWGSRLVLNAVTYLIGWAGIGAGVAHLFFGKATSRSIGFAQNPYELEVGFADLAMGVVAVLASGHSPEYWWAIILTSVIFRVGCGIGHIRSIVKDHNYAVNNTAILFINFVVPAFLIFAYAMWAPQ